MFNLFQLRKRAQLKTESENVKEQKPEVVKVPKVVVAKPAVIVKEPKVVVKEVVKKETVKKIEEVKENLNSKKIFAYVGKKLVGEYDSITKCGVALSMSRPSVKKAIESGETLDNGFKLKFK